MTIEFTGSHCERDVILCGVRWYMSSSGEIVPGAQASSGGRWRLDETYVKIKGTWKYLYRAVDKTAATLDFQLTAKRYHKAALRFLRKAIGRNGVP
jgi:putative transposase